MKHLCDFSSWCGACLLAPIAGWARNSSRDLRVYVQPDNLTALIEQPTVCAPPAPLLLLVVVCSAVINFEARQAVRDTWGSPSNVSDNTIRLAFLLGATESEELQSRVESESALYGDIIQEGFLDTYNNLTLKSVMLLKWVRSHCRHARYVMKTDDDMFVNLGRLVTQLRADVARFRPPTSLSPSSESDKLPDYAKEPRGLLLGALICGARPIANTRSKWYAPRYMYAERTYPNYLSGTGYVMSADVVLRLFNAALHTPLFHLEDVYITGMCAKAAGLRPRDHPGFSYQRRKLEPCAYRNSLITSHRLNSTDLRQVWQRIQAPDLQCPVTTVASKVRKGGRSSKACV
ncbi:hypothetical protein B566_EDAN007612 [Ephemera danica]|nr:hypothetical protein B566_EDAN007612 [Ephemera danica]